VVRGLGPARFGLLALAWTVVGYFNLFDLGIGRAATRRVAQVRSAEGGGAAARHVAATAAAAQVVIGLITAMLLVVATPQLVLWLVPNAPELHGEARLVLLALAGAVPAVLVSNVLRAVLEGYARFDLMNAARMPLTTLIFVIPAVGVMLGWTLPQIVIGLALSRYAAAALFYALYRVASGREVGGGRVDPSELGVLLRFGGWVAVSNALIPLVMYLERFVISAQHGTDALAYYAAPQELVFKLLMIPAAVSGVLMPALTGLYNRGATAELGRRGRQGLKLITLLSALPALVLIAAGEPLLRIWVGPEYAAAGGAVLRWLAFAAFLNALAFVAVVVSESCNRPDLSAKYHLVELPIYAVVLWTLVSQYGIVGAAWAWTLRTVSMTTVLFLLAFRTTALTPRAAFGDGTGIGMLIGLGVLVLAQLAASAGHPLLAIVLLPIVLVTALWTWTIRPDERAEVRRWLRLHTAPAGE
jgi:O-antigen/teichoic acid export membrane protein